MDRDTKFKEQQPDKMEIINRLEKEKKVMQKKEKEEEKRKNTKPKTAAKPKRMNNIDWTREYENDSYDNDEMDAYLI